MALSLNCILVICLLNILKLTMFELATVTIDGPCPIVPTVKNFNLTAFARGIWYHIARYPNAWEDRGDCGYLEFTKNGDVMNYRTVDTIDKHISSVNGFIDFAKDAGDDAVVVFDSPSYKGAEGTELLPVYVLGVDYDKYAIGYECKYNKTTNKRHDYAWVVSRNKTFDEDTKRTVDERLKSSDLIKEDYLIWNHITDEFCKTQR